MKLVRTAAYLCLAALCLLACVGLLTRARTADVAVVLGNTVESNGQPSPRLAARLDRARQCYARHQCRYLFVSGGVEPSGLDEAAVMRAYLIAHGVPADRIETDSEGVDTWSSARNASAYMQSHGLSRALAVTQYFHLPRTMLALKRFGVRDVSGAYPRFWEWRDVYSMMREVPAIVWYAIRAPQPFIKQPAPVNHDSKQS